MQHEVSEFIVVAPANMGKSIQWAQRELQSFLEGHFPFYRFRIEPFGPFAADDEFTVIPDHEHVLRSFDLTNIKLN